LPLLKLFIKLIVIEEVNDSISRMRSERTSCEGFIMYLLLGLEKGFYSKFTSRSVRLDFLDLLYEVH